MRYLGVPIKTKSYLFGDNRSVVTTSTLPHSTLGKRHNILAYHQVMDAIASKILAYHWIRTGYNLSDMLSRHWYQPSVYDMIMKLLITRGPMRLIPNMFVGSTPSPLSNVHFRNTTKTICSTSSCSQLFVILTFEPFLKRSFSQPMSFSCIFVFVSSFIHMDLSII